ncbi:replication-relaxation family protein, partial [Dactylosporangium sp. NPDC005572]|uniref:replication-relaxation family protein n=1 Tax=Dactylosporangium sp. NPDC005572 TaxID=3156889 RepID=UPI0033B0FC83
MPRISDPSRRAAHSLIGISHRLRPRDYAIASLLDEHTTLTTDQLSSALFTNVTTCRHRLLLLRRIGFIDRFIRNRPNGPNPVCWLPGLLSACYMALSRDDNPPTAKALRERQDRVYASPTLDHLLAVNQFFVSLLVHARHRPSAELTRWWSERSTAARFGG